MSPDLNCELPLSELFDNSRAAQHQFESVGANVVANHCAVIPAQRTANYENCIDYVHAEARRDLTAAILAAAIVNRTK